MKKGKIFSIVLAAAMVLNIGTAVFADTSLTDQSTVRVNKTYKAENEGTTSPRDTFALEQLDSAVTDGDAQTAPDLVLGGCMVAEGAATTAGGAGEFVITLPEYTKVGVYEYTLEESIGNTAGVTYRATPFKVIVTVINGDDGKLIRIPAVHTEEDGEPKMNDIENVYSAGELDITKTVTGNLGDKDKYFTFNVMLEPVEGKYYMENYVVEGGSNSQNPATIKIGEMTQFYLKDGDTIKISNLPYNVKYTVTEDEVDGYNTTSTGDEGIIDSALETAAFTNDKNGTIDTGIILNNMPYIVMITVIAAAAVVMIVVKRNKNRK